MRKITKIVIHHSAVEQPDLQKLINSINNSHKFRLKQPADINMSHIAYHYIIGVDGQVKQTRDLDSVGWHASNREINKESIGICLSGDLDSREPYKAQLESLYNLINKLQRQYTLSIHLHREYTNKSCPGDMFNLDMLDPINFVNLKTNIDGELLPCIGKNEEYNQTLNDCTKYASGAILSKTINKRLDDEYFDSLKEYSSYRGAPDGEGTDYVLQGELTLDHSNIIMPLENVEGLILPIVSEEAKKVFAMGYRGMISRKTSKEIVVDRLDGIFKGNVTKLPNSSHATTIEFDFDEGRFVEYNSKYGIFKRNKTIYHTNLKKLIDSGIVKSNVIFYVKYKK